MPAFELYIQKIKHLTTNLITNLKIVAKFT